MGTAQVQSAGIYWRGLIDIHLGVLSFLVGVVEAPVVVVVRRNAVAGEIVTGHPCTVEVGDVDLAHLGTVLQEDVDTVIVLQEVSDAVGKWIGFLFTFVDPVTLINNTVL
jgi:hypothetical protein